MDYVGTERGKSPRVTVHKKTLKARPALDLVWKEDVEEILTLADDAIRTARPEPEPEPPERSMVGAGDPIRAPMEEGRRVEPTEIRYRDGLQVAPMEDVQAAFEARTRQVYQVEVETVVEAEFDNRPIEIIYEFDRPITSVRGAYGTLYTARSETADVEFQPGMRATRIVQVIEPGELPKVEDEAVKTFEVHVEAGRAVWDHAEDDE